MATELVTSNMHKYASGAKTKGYLKNTDDNKIKYFYFNPTELEWERSATYQEIASPGLSYPLFNYVRGNSIPFSISLKVIDKPHTGAIAEWEEFLSNFLPPTINNGSYKKPKEVIVVMGDFLRECILESLNTKYEDFNEDLLPTECTFTLNLRQV